MVPRRQPEGGLFDEASKADIYVVGVLVRFKVLTVSFCFPILPTIMKTIWKLLNTRYPGSLKPTYITTVARCLKHFASKYWGYCRQECPAKHRYTLIYFEVYIKTYTHIRTYITYIRTYITYIRTYIYIHTHIHIHTYIQYMHGVHIHISYTTRLFFRPMQGEAKGALDSVSDKRCTQNITFFLNCSINCKLKM